MAFLTDDEKQQLRTAIADAESVTTAELVTVIADRSDHYHYIPLLWAALLALLLPGINLLLAQPLSLLPLYQLQVLIFFIAALVFQIPWLKYRLIPQSVRFHRAGQAARQQFVEQGLHTTAAQTGVLIYVSVAEHYIEIITDRGIREKIGNDAWQQTIREFIGLVRQGKTFDGFMLSVARCREVLSEQFPAGQMNPNELPDHLIELYYD